MALSTGLTGPYQLSPQNVSANVYVDRVGAYALGALIQDGIFEVRYVGRSDDDVAGRLQSWTGKPRYTYFKFGYFASAQAAFERECRMFHDFGGTEKLDNAIHPDRPSGSSAVCPVCPRPTGLMGLGFGRR